MTRDPDAVPDTVGRLLERRALTVVELAPEQAATVRRLLARHFPDNDELDTAS